MSLWQEFEQNRSHDVLVEEVPSSMYPVLSSWLVSVTDYIDDPYRLAVNLKNIFHIDLAIPNTRPNNYLEAPDHYKLTKFLLDVALNDAKLFFTMIVFLLQTNGLFKNFASQLEEVLYNGGHKYSVQTINGSSSIVERLPTEQKQLMDGILNGQQVYASEFRDATGEAFQALESALKFYFGEDKGKNLGSLKSWASQLFA